MGGKKPPPGVKPRHHAEFSDEDGTYSSQRSVPLCVSWFPVLSLSNYALLVQAMKERDSFCWELL